MYTISSLVTSWSSASSPLLVSRRPAAEQQRHWLRSAGRTHHSLPNAWPRKQIIEITNISVPASLTSSLSTHNLTNPRYRDIDFRSRRDKRLKFRNFLRICHGHRLFAPRARSDLAQVQHRHCTKVTGYESERLRKRPAMKVTGMHSLDVALF